MSHNISFNTKSLDVLAKSFGIFEDDAIKAIASAENSTMNFVRKAVRKEVPKVYALSDPDEISKYDNIYKAKRGNLNASLIYVSRRLSLIHFDLVFAPTGANKVHVVTKIKESNGYNEVLKGFLARTSTKEGGSEKLNVFHRIGKKSFPTKGRYADVGYMREKIDVVRTLSFPQMIRDKQVEDKALSVIDKKLMPLVEKRLSKRLGEIAENMKG